MFHCLFYKKDEQRPGRDAYGRQTSNLLTPKANTQRHYANAKEAWEICVEALAHPEVVTDYWEAKTIRKFATSYIPFRVRVTEGQKNQHVQAITAVGWGAHIIVCIASYAHDEDTDERCGPQVLYTEGFAKKIEDSIWTAIREWDLDRNVTVRGQNTFGPFEIQLCIEYALTGSSRARLARLQDICSLIFPCATGIRPSGLAAGHPEFAKYGQYLKFGDLQVISRGQTVWDITVTIRNHKGHNTTLLGKTMIYRLCVREKSANVFFDTWWIVLYLWHRGALGKYETLEQLMLTEDDRLVITLPDEPFFVTCRSGTTELTTNPLSTRQLTERVKTLTVNAGLGSTITYYDLRREFADDVSIKPSGQPTGLIVGHQDANITLKAAVTICVLVQMDTSRIFGAKVSA